jgi:hypothetical protein
MVNPDLGLDTRAASDRMREVSDRPTGCPGWPVAVAEGPRGLARDSQMMIMSSMRKCIGQIAAALVVGAACAGAAGQCPIQTFGPSQTVIPFQGDTTVVGDFNRDEWYDVATADWRGNRVLVWLNARSTFSVSFLPFIAYGVGRDPFNLASGDVDGDGFIDLVSANRGTNDVSVLYGNGDGSFQPEVYQRVGPLPISLLVADLDGDSRDDIVTGNFGFGAASSVSVLLSSDNRLPGFRIDYPAEGGNPYLMRTGDVDGDGHKDIVISNAFEISIFLNDGSGGLLSELYRRQNVSGLVVVDLDGNGVDEVVVGGTSPGGVEPRINVFELGQDERIVLVSSLLVTNAAMMSVFSAVDFNLDYRIDLVATNGFLFRGRGDRSFEEVGAFWPPVSLSSVFVDLNRDSLVDVLEGGIISVRLNTSFPVTQQPQSTVACPIGPTTFSAAANGTPPYTYRWQYRAVETIPFDPASWIDLVPGTNTVAGPSGPLEFNAAGTDTGTLTVDREALLGWPASTLIGSFRCIIGSACGDVITQEAVMTTSDRCSCYDFNSDENVDLLDAQQMAQVFVGLITPQPDWLSGDLNADENADLSDAQALAVFVVSGTCGV